MTSHILGLLPKTTLRSPLETFRGFQIMRPGIIDSLLVNFNSVAISMVQVGFTL